MKQVLEDGEPLCALARQNGIHPGVLSKWVKKKKQSSALNDFSQHQQTENRPEIMLRLIHLEDRVETLRSILEKHLRMQYKP